MFQKLSLKCGKSFAARSQTRLFRSMGPLSSGAIVAHRETPENNLDTPFEFTEENKKTIETILQKFPKNYPQSAVMPVLTLAQEQNDNWLPLTAMNKVAEMLDMSPIKVYEVATFYTMYNREPMPKFHIQLCGTTHCLCCGSDVIQKTIEDHLGVKTGEITKDNMFLMTEVECLGACVNAPMVQVNNHEYYENLTPENTIKFIEDLRNGTAKVGPQNGQDSCEGPDGQTSLHDVASLDPNSFCRDFDKIGQDMKKAAAEGAKK